MEGWRRGLRPKDVVIGHHFTPGAEESNEVQVESQWRQATVTEHHYTKGNPFRLVATWSSE